MSGNQNDGRETDEEEPAGDNASDERLLFGERREESVLFAGTRLGLTSIHVAAGQVGQFELLDRTPVNDLAIDGETLLVANENDVQWSDGSTLASLGFGPATAVGIDDSWLYAASDERAGSESTGDGPTGERRIARLARARIQRTAIDGENGSAEWETVGTVSDPRRFDGNLLASGEGIVRVSETLDYLGLDDVRDISAAGPLAATADGLYGRKESKDGWEQLLAGDASAVVDGGAIVDGQLFEFDGEWEAVSLPGDTAPCALVFGPMLAVMTEDGTVHIRAEPEQTHDGRGGWRSQALGVGAASAFVALEP